MRLSNQKNRTLIAALFNVLFVVFLLSIVFFFIDTQQLRLLGHWNYLLILISVFPIVFFYLLGDQIFEYDSDGEAINFINKNVLPFKNKIVKDEFPKYKLHGFNVINFLVYKRLYISLKSKKEKNITLKYDISFLTSSDIKDLKISLQKVVKNNKETK